MQLAPGHRHLIPASIGAGDSSAIFPTALHQNNITTTPYLGVGTDSSAKIYQRARKAHNMPFIISDHHEGLAKLVLNNLENQQDWTNISSHTDTSLPRPLISGLPPRRMYVHPDEQIAIIKAEKALGETIIQKPEYEWVLPVHLSEKMSLEAFAAIFDSFDALPPAAKEHENLKDDCPEWRTWRGAKRGKRALMAVVHDDSTVVYYMMHDGIVKPRQN